MYGDGKQTRAFQYVSDLVRVIPQGPYPVILRLIKLRQDADTHCCID